MVQKIEAGIARGSFYASLCAGVSDRDGYPVAVRIRSLKSKPKHRCENVSQINAFQLQLLRDLKTSLKSQGAGGGQMSRKSFCPNRRPPHSGIFFRRSRFSELVFDYPEQIHSIIQWGRAAAREQNTYLFPGGGQKFTRSKSGTGGQRHKSFRRFRKFFLERPGGGIGMFGSTCPGPVSGLQTQYWEIENEKPKGPHLEKLSRNSPGGGSVDHRDI